MANLLLKAGASDSLRRKPPLPAFGRALAEVSMPMTARVELRSCWPWTEGTDASSPRLSVPWALALLTCTQCLVVL